LLQVAAAIAAIEKIIETAASIPEGQNELKRNQLRMLATLNGTLRDDEGQACQNCTFFPGSLVNYTGGEIGHRKYDCPQMRSFSANVVCHRCGQAGHFAKDCKVNLTATNQGYGGGNTTADLDKEYQDLMAEVGGGGGGGIGYGQAAGRIENQPWQQPQQAVASVAPWVHT
jgi:splicing factor 1